MPPAGVMGTLAPSGSAMALASEASQLFVEMTRDLRHIPGRVGIGVAREERGLVPNAFPDLVIAAHNAGERRLDLQELAARAQQGRIAALSVFLARHHVDDDANA